MTYVQEIDQTHFAPSGICATALRWYDDAGGMLSGGDQAALQDIMARCHVSLLPEADAPPCLFYVGPLSPAAEFFGSDWATRAIGKSGIPDRSAEERCIAAYYDAMTTDRPVLGLCSMEFDTGHSGRRHGFYTRALIPLHRQRGQRPLILCAVDLMRSCN